MKTNPPTVFTLTFDHNGSHVTADVAPQRRHTTNPEINSGHYSVWVKGGSTGIHRLIFAKCKETGNWKNITVSTNLHLTIIQHILDGITEKCAA